MATVLLGRVGALWRFPVKSLLGEQLEAARCDERGIEGDRRLALRGADGRLASSKTSRRFRRMPGLLSMRAALDDGGACWLCFPGGARVAAASDEAARLASAVVHEPVVPVVEAAVPHHDDAPLHLLSRSSLAWLAERRPSNGVDERRFRPNVVLEATGPGRPEDGWVGRDLLLGEVAVTIEARTERCVLPTLAQDGLAAAPWILRALHEDAEDRLGVYARIQRPGIIRVGDEVVLAR